MTVLAELKTEIQKIRDEVGRAVVGIGNRRGAGSGIVIGKDTILTNAHNLWGEEPTVTFADGREVRGTVAAADVDGDIAIVTADTGDVAALEWADAEPEIGAPVFALSNPAGRGLRVTFGFVSGTQRAFRGPRGRRIAGSIEHTAPLLPGSSGGPTVDERGRLVGVNTNRLGEGFYLAIPADAALRARTEKLARGETPQPRRLGVALAPGHVARHLRRAVGLPDADGMLVRGVEKDSPAERAGLREGDLLTKANGKALADADVLQEVLSADGDVTLTVLRGSDEREVGITF